MRTATLDAAGWLSIGSWSIACWAHCAHFADHGEPASFLTIETMLHVLVTCEWLLWRTRGAKSGGGRGCA